MAPALIFGLLALSVGLISGYGRLFNLGVGANFGISAYAVAAISQGRPGIPVVISLYPSRVGGPANQPRLSTRRPGRNKSPAAGRLNQTRSASG